MNLLYQAHKLASSAYRIVITPRKGGVKRWFRYDLDQ